MIKWLSDNEFKLGSCNFTIDLTAGYNRRPSEINNFTLVKTKKFLEIYFKLAQTEKNINNVLELGIFQGGGLAFLDKLFEPNKIVGVELSKVPVPALDDYAINSGDKVKIYYGTSQSDRAALNSILNKEFNGPLDMVVDDASHWYEHSRVSIETLFPHVRPGGLYILEDWAWNYRKPHQSPDHPWFNKPALANLVIECFEDIASNNTIESIQVFEELAIIRKAKTPETNAIFADIKRRGRPASQL